YLISCNESGIKFVRKAIKKELKSYVVKELSQQPMSNVANVTTCPFTSQLVNRLICQLVNSQKQSISLFSPLGEGLRG
ncbi:MAG: hypothetical protein D8H98_06635, partial [Prevotella sp.]